MRCRQSVAASNSLSPPESAQSAGSGDEAVDVDAHFDDAILTVDRHLPSRSRVIGFEHIRFRVTEGAQCRGTGLPAAVMSMVIVLWL